MPEIKVNIKFDVGGTDAFKGMFTEPVKNLDELHKRLKKLSGAPSGLYDGMVKVNPELKQAAAHAAKLVQNLIRAKGLSGKESALAVSGIEANLERGKLGGFVGKAKVARRGVVPQGGKTQLAHAQELQMAISNAYSKMLRDFQVSLAKVPSQVNSAGFANNISQQMRDTQAGILRAFRTSMKSGEGVTAEAGNNLRQMLKEGWGNITRQMSMFVGKAAFGQAKFEDIGVTIEDFGKRFKAEVGKLSQVFGGRVPANIAKMQQDYDAYLASMKTDAASKRAAATLTNENSKQIIAELKRSHLARLDALRNEAKAMLATRAAGAKGAGIDVSVDNLFEQSVAKLGDKVKTLTSGLTIDASLGQQMSQELSAKVMAFQREMVIAFDRLKAQAGGLATPEIMTEMKEKIRSGFTAIGSTFEGMIAQFRTAQNIAGKMSAEFGNLRYALLGNVQKIGDSFGGQVPADVAKINLEFRNWLNKVMVGVQRLAAQGRLTPVMFNKLMGIANNVYGRAAKGMLDISKVVKNGQKEIETAYRKYQQDQLKFEQEVAKTKASVAKRLRDQITRQIYSLTTESFGAPALKKGGIDRAIGRLQLLIKEMEAEIDRAAPKTKADLAKMMQSISEKIGASVATIKGGRKADIGTVMSGVLFNRATVQSFAAVFGHMMSQMGQQITKFAESTRLRGQLTSGISDMFMSAFMVSKFFIFREIAMIGAGIVEILVNVLSEAPRQLIGIAGGIIEAFGGALKAGLATSLYLTTMAAMSAAAAPVTAGISVLVGAVVGGLLAIKAALEGIGRFVSSFISSLLQVVYSIIKAGVMIVVSIVKGLADTIKATFKSLWEGIATATQKFIEFMKESFSALAQFAKASLMEFAAQAEYATRAFKETVGVAGQSVGAFQKLMLSLRSGFAFEKEDAGEAVFDIISSGFRDIAEAQKLVAASGTLAVASTSSLATATNAMITAWQNFQGQGETIDSIMKSINGAVVLGRMTMEEFGTSMKSVMGLASRLNLSFSDTVGSLAMMTRVFGRGSIEESTKYFNRFLEAIYMPSTRASKGVAELGINVERLGKGTMMQGIFEIVDKLKNLDLKDVNKVFTTIQSRRAWLGLTKDVDQFKKLLAEMGPVSEGVGWQLEQMMNTPQRLLGRLKQTFMVFQVLVGQQLWSVIVSGIKQIVDWSARLVDVLQTDRVQKFFSEFVKWVTPIVNTVFRPFMDFLENIYDFLNRGLGRGNDFSKIFQTEAAMRLQATIINVIENVKGLVLYIIEVVRNLGFVHTAWEKIRDAVKAVFEYFESTSWKDWVADVLNVGARIKGMIENIFLGTDVRWFNKVMEEIFSNIISGIQMVGRILQTILIPVFDRIMALVGVKLKNSLIRGFLEAIDLMASKLGDTGMFGPLVEQLRKITMQAGGIVKGGGRIETMQMGQRGAGKGYSEMMKGYLQAQMGNVQTLLKHGLGPLAHFAGMKGGGGDWFAGMGKIMEGVIKNKAGGATLPVMTRGMMAARSEKEMVVLSELMQRYAPSILAAIDDMPMKMKLKGNGKYGYEIDVGDITKDLKRLIAPKGLDKLDADTKGMIMDLLDVFVTQLSNLSSPSFRQAAGIDEPTFENTGLKNLLSIFASMSADYNDSIESMSYVNDGIATALPKVRDEIVAFGRQLAKSSGEIGRLVTDKWNTLNKPFSPEQFQYAVTGRKPEMKYEAQTALRQYEGLKVREKDVAAQQAIKLANINNATMGRILDILDALEREGVKMPDFMTKAGRTDFAEKTGGRNFATEFGRAVSDAFGGISVGDALGQLAAGTPVKGMVETYRKATTPAYVMEMVNELKSLDGTAEMIRKQMEEIIGRFGQPEEIKAKAQKEQADNFDVFVRKGKDEDLQNEYNRLVAERRKRTTGGADFYEQKAQEIEAKVKERRPEYEEYKKGLPTGAILKTFEEWQRDVMGYRDIASQSQADAYRYESGQRGKREGGQKATVDELDRRIAAIKDEAKFRTGERAIKEQTTKAAGLASTPEEKKKIEQEGAKKIDALNQERLNKERALLEGRVKAGTATAGDKKRLEEVKTEQAGMERKKVAEEAAAKEKVTKEEQEKKRLESVQATIKMAEDIKKQLVISTEIRDTAKNQAANVANIAKITGAIGVVVAAPSEEKRDKGVGWFVDRINEVV